MKLLTATPLLVTSFGPDLFEASGRRLLESIQAVDPAARRLVCYEDAPGPSAPLLRELAGHPTMLHRLDDDPFLQNWLAANRDVIPVHLGGTREDCRCPGREERHAKHKFGCPGQWMNRNASRWFRKVASYRAAANLPFRWVVWLDADCILLRPFTAEAVEGLLGGHGVAFCKGHRPAVESGVVLFDLKRGGRILIDALCEKYVSKRYRGDERWDDGFQTALVAKARPDCGPLDLVHPTRYKGKTNDVIPHTPLAEFVRHEKGRHGTKTGVMR